ncbi:MAG: DNA-binding transcriptional regulator BolA [Alphaproteobacteria bacterium MarineAlpha9_Bin2]|nr:MAG: DNA-binding transcriptional regulator BolA [Alphaproteobacteria bacterium MarineAlpha9_Bin2]
MTKSERKNRIEQVIIKFLSPQYISIIDESALHEGHNSAPKGGESHFKIIIKSHLFSGKTRIERERMVQNLLAEEFKSGLHALTMSLDTP